MIELVDRSIGMQTQVYVNVLVSSVARANAIRRVCYTVLYQVPGIYSPTKRTYPDKQQHNPPEKEKKTSERKKGLAQTKKKKKNHWMDDCEATTRKILICLARMMEST